MSVDFESNSIGNETVLKQVKVDLYNLEENGSLFDFIIKPTSATYRKCCSNSFK